MYKDDRVRLYFDNQCIQWKFIVKRAPWKGGFYERLIGATKNALKKVIGNACLSIRDLQSLLPEVESRINDRPLTYVTGDFEKLEDITPSKILYGHKLGSLPCGVDSDEILDPSYCSREYINRLSIDLSSRLNSM